MAKCVIMITLKISGDGPKILATGISPLHNFLGIAYDDKCLKIWEVFKEDWKIVGKIKLLKKITSLTILDPDSEQYLILTNAMYPSPLPNPPMLTILVADKAGMVYKFFICRSCPENNESYSVIAADNYNYKVVSDTEKCCIKPVLGHVSMLLDILVTPDAKYVITSDRDEKIRVSHYPRCYDIQSYCLGHTKFVTSICISPAEPSILFSGSADGTLRSWKYERGQLLTTTSIRNQERIPENSQMLVTKIAVSKCLIDRHLVLVALVKENEKSWVLIYKVGSSVNQGCAEELKLIQKIEPEQLQTFEDFCFGLENTPLRLYLLQGNSSPINKIEIFEFCQETSNFVKNSKNTVENGQVDCSDYKLEYDIAQHMLFEKGDNFYEEINVEFAEDGSTEYCKNKKLKKISNGDNI